MKKAFSFFLVLFLIFKSFSADAQAQACIQNFEWLKGKWSMNKNGSVVVEQWSFLNGNLKCMSYEVKGNDTTLIENASISCIAGKSVFTYYPEKDQSGKTEPVHFVLISEKDNTFIFENKEHDFPQRVVYQKVNDKECHAWIEGVQSGKHNKVDFNYKRTN